MLATGLTLVLSVVAPQEPTPVSLYVMDEDGVRLSGAAVHLCEEGVVFRRRDDPLLGRTDTHGELALPGVRDRLAAGKALVVERPGHEPKVLRAADVRGRTECKLARAEKLMLRFSREADGSPVAGVRVALTAFPDVALRIHAVRDPTVAGIGAHPRVRVWVGVSDGGGAVRLEGVPAGEYWLRVEHPVLSILHEGFSPFRKIPVPADPEVLHWRLTEPYVCVLHLTDEPWSELGMGPKGPVRVEHSWSARQFELFRKYPYPEYRMFMGMVGLADRPLPGGGVQHQVRMWSPSIGSRRLDVEMVPLSVFSAPVDVDYREWRTKVDLGGLQVGVEVHKGWEHCGELRLRAVGGNLDVGVPLGQVLKLPAGEYELNLGSGYRTLFRDARLAGKRVEVKAGETTVVPWSPTFPLMPCRLRVEPPPGLPVAGFRALVEMLDPVVDPEPLYRAHTLDFPEVLWLPPGKVRVLGRDPAYEPVAEELQVKADVEGIQDLVVPVRFAER